MLLFSTSKSELNIILVSKTQNSKHLKLNKIKYYLLLTNPLELLVSHYQKKITAKCILLINIL